MYIIVKMSYNIYYKMKFTCLFDSVCSPFIPLLAVIVRLFKFDIQGILICIVKKWSKTYTSR